MEGKRRWHRWTGKLIAIVFFALVALLLANRARAIDWPAVGQALQGYQAATIIQALLLTALGYLVFATYDLVGRRYAHHQLPTRRVMSIAAVCYAFNLNLGATLGGVGLRYRLYLRQGLSTRQILRVIALGLVTNWSGYLLVAGSTLLLVPPALPQQWPLPAWSLQAAGALMLTLLGVWLLACTFARRREWHWRHLHLLLPSLPMALSQLALSALSWGLLALTIFSLMPDPMPLLTVMGVYTLSILATLVIRIPGGLGVVEATFILMLSPVYPEVSLLAALLAWRALWYLLPLLLALPFVLLLETRWRGQKGGPAHLGATQVAKTDDHDDHPSRLASLPQKKGVA